MKMSVRFFIGGLLLLAHASMAQKVERIDPPHWWAGLQSDTLQLLIKGSKMDRVKEVSVPNSTLKIIRKPLANANYVLLELVGMRTVEAGTLDIRLNNKRVPFTIKPKYTAEPKGLSAKDQLYLITPDRFANGNPANDAYPSMTEPVANRTEPYGRHGGDVQGIINHIPYFKELNQTALWINPLLENNQPEASYHGYAITDHYRLDPRFGTNQDFRVLVDQLHANNMKMVMDVVYNHVGSQHYLFLSPPDSSWFHFFPTYLQTNYRATTWFDPYASQADSDRMRNGWFDKHMPDLNQQQPDCAKWLIQNSIWWVAEFGVDAYRIDTYAYPDQRFMAKLGQEMRREFPNFFLFGETWVHGPQVQSWFSDDNPRRPFRTYQQSLTDFQLYFAIKEGLTREPDWSSGIHRVYYTLAGDYLYNHPEWLVTFVDNHDEGRFYGMVGKDFNKYKMGLTLLYTLRGIPCLYYGTEILMQETDGHGKMRQDFPGGWKEDARNAFVPAGRTEEENRAFDLVKALTKLRRENSALTTGKTIQFAPNNGAYAYARMDEQSSFLVFVNGSSKPVAFTTSYYDEVLHGQRTLTDALLGSAVELGATVELGPWEVLVLKLP